MRFRAALRKAIEHGFVISRRALAPGFGESHVKPGASARRLICALLFGPICAALLCAGCRKSDGPSENGKSPDAKPAAKTDGKTHPPANAKKQPRPPRTPDAAVEALLRGIQQKRPEAVWDFLPASYQRDVTDLVHLFGGKMDPELWRRTMAVGWRIVKLCRDRKAAILASRSADALRAGDRQRLSADWDALLALAGTILESNLADLDKVKTLDVRAFLQSTGGDVLQQLARFSRLLPDDALRGELEQFADLDVKVVASDATTAKVRLSLRSAAGAARDVSFVKVDGKWVPEGIAANWKSGVAAVHKDLEQKLRPEVLQANKQKVLAILAGFEKELAAMEAAKTEAEFQRLFEASALSGLVVATFRSVTRGGAATAVPVTPKNIGKRKSKPPGGITVTVVVRGVLGDEAAEAVADSLLNLGSVDVGAYTTGSETTSFPVFNVKDFNAFREKIRFALVVSADATKREIVLRLRMKGSRPKRKTPRSR